MKNPVRHIHPDAFRGLLVLLSLKLQSTQLHQLPHLKHIGNSLIIWESIDFMQFKGANAEDFSHLRKIEHLRISHAGLKGTPLGLDHIANTIKRMYFPSNAIETLATMEGVNFVTLWLLDLRRNVITHLRPEVLIFPHLERLNLVGNNLIALDEVTQYTWGGSLPDHIYLAISIWQNPWHCNRSLDWMLGFLCKYNFQIVYAKPTRKPYIKNVEQLVCMSPAARIGTRVVPRDIIKGIDISILSMGDLEGKCHRNLVLKIKCHLTSD